MASPRRSVVAHPAWVSWDRSRVKTATLASRSPAASSASRTERSLDGVNEYQTEFFSAAQPNGSSLPSQRAEESTFESCSSALGLRSHYPCVPH